MLHTITPAEMRRVERRMFQNSGTTSLVLMERAAAHIADAAAPFLRGGGRLLAVCGAGNNGGDGLAAARILMGRMPMLQTTVWQLPGAPTAETAEQWTRLLAFQARLHTVALTDEGAPPTVPGDTACALDAMFGTGLTRPLAGAAREATLALARAQTPVVAVDVPSGVCALRGTALGGAVAVRATATVTFHRPKPGLLLAEGLEHCGRLTVGDIGIPSEADDAPGMAVLAANDALLPPRRRNTHKGDYGRLVLLSGSFGMAGAAALCAMAALRTGAGLVTVACPEGIVPTVQALCPCATCLPLPPDPEAAWGLLEAALARADALAAGCGLGQSPFAKGLLARLIPWLCAHSLPAVLDADALNWLATLWQNPVTAAAMQGDPPPAALAVPGGLRLPDSAVLTPHLGEAARLLGISVAQVAGAQAEAARELHARYGAAVVLKSAASVLVARDGEAINPYGTPAMAKGGSGDALAGVLGALLAGQPTYGLHGVRLLQTACALHGLAGMAAAESCGERGMLATDLCEALGRVPDTVTREVFRIAALPGRIPATYGAETLSMRDGRDEIAALAPWDGGTAPLSAARACNGYAPGDKRAPLGLKVRVTVDRPLGSLHPKHRDTVYRLNYGYVAEVLAADNEWQDAYIWGVAEPVEVFEGEVVAVIQRLNDVEDSWVVAACGTRITEAEVRTGTDFVERYFKTVIHVLR